MKSSVLFFFSCSCFSVISNKSQSDPWSQGFIPRFPSRSFTVLTCKFRPLVHFELMFVYGMRQQYNLILLYMDIQFSQHQFLKDIILIPVDLSWYPCQKSIAYEGMGLFLNSQFYTSITKLLNHYFPNHSAHFSSMMKNIVFYSYNHLPNIF